MWVCSTWQHAFCCIRLQSSSISDLSVPWWGLVLTRPCSKLFSTASYSVVLPSICLCCPDCFYTCSCKFGIAFSVYLFGKICDGSALQHMIGHSHGEVHVWMFVCAHCCCQNRKVFVKLRLTCADRPCLVSTILTSQWNLSLQSSISLHVWD